MKNITKFLGCFFFIILLFQTLSSSIRCERIDDQHSLQEEQLPGLSDELKRLNRSMSEEQDMNGGRRTSSKVITEHVKGGTGGGGGGHKGYGGGDNINSRPKNKKNGASSPLMNSTMSLMLQLIMCSFICFLVFLF